MADLRDELAILRNRTDLIGSTDSAEDQNFAAVWEAIDLLADVIAANTPS